MARRKQYDLRELAIEAVRRTGEPSYVIRLSDPPSPSERLQLLSARLLRCPIAILPHPCATMDEWQQRYGPARWRN